MRTAPYLLLLLFLPSLLQSQSDTHPPDIEFLSSGLNFSPLIANTFEPRVGFVFQAGNSDLRLDIGNSIDLLAFNALASSGDKLVFGADFFTWTALRQDENFHFPVDAVDYLFGLNFSYSYPMGNAHVLESRLRWSHISAHLVDGRFQKESMSWREGQLPRVYSREYFELIVAYNIDNFLRPYAGLSYVYHIDPADLGKEVAQIGFEATLPHNSDDRIHPYLAYDLRLLKISEYSAAHSAQIGIKFGHWYGRGLNLFIALYNGMSYHGEYHDARISYWGPGLTIDF
jgi:Protein of unknown function (DUF1207)